MLALLGSQNGFYGKSPSTDASDEKLLDLATNMNPTTSVIETLAKLVAIPSVNPNYAGGTGETKISEWIFQFFRDANIQVEKQPVLPERFNVIAKIPSKNDSRRIIFEAHVDTVSTKGMDIPPYEPTIKNGKLYGRGSCDTKAGLSAMMHAMLQLSTSHHDALPEVWFVATVDEEFSYRGVAEFCKIHSTADAAIVAEPTELRVITASKGLLRFKIITEGISAHSAKPHLGDNAILQMNQIIQAIQEDTLALAKTEHTLLGPATCNIGTISGGTQINLVPDYCEIEIDRRLLPHESPNGVWQHYARLLNQLMHHEPTIRATLLEPLLTDLPLETDSGHQAVRVMSDVLETHKLSGDPSGVPFCSDASKFGDLGIPAMILGPGCIDQAHAAIEYVDCAQVEKAVEIYRDFVIHFASHSIR
ncbi:M20 family metallopeptidase [Rhodopirellula sp.]|nr:M20 family metallopeptidase [Rhodopirellula sp.]